MSWKNRAKVYLLHLSDTLNKLKQTKQIVWQKADSGSRINYNCKYGQSLFVVNH